MIYVLTYATHSFGNFDEMIDNDYGVQFVILGWGKKWEGYMGKLNMIYDYCKKLKENDIVIQLDGFDVWINNYLSEAIKYFKEKNYKVLFSKETTDDSRYLGLKEYLNKKIFATTCKNGVTMNAGMYMGYVKYLLPIMENALNGDESDDQRMFNKLCYKFDISVDHEKKVFENVFSDEAVKNSKAVFVQYPGKPSIERYSRAVVEYTPFLYKEILIIVFIIIISVCITYKMYKFNM
tara:strand:+ start:3890 stop:4597 length:708 start_codon:yes stop_codon:yes gene_type:complete